MQNKTYDFASQSNKDLLEGTKERLAQLSSMSEIELMQQDPIIFSRFSVGEMRQIFAPSPTKTKSCEASKETLPLGRNRRSINKSRFWYCFPAAVRSQFIGAIASISVLLMAVTANGLGHKLLPLLIDPLPLNASLWPVCERLAPTSDGCRYHSRLPITWDRTAELLEQPIAQLRANNQHLIQHAKIKPGDLIIVWRDRLPLEEK